MDDRIEKVLIGPERLIIKRKNFIPVSLLVLSLVFLGALYFLREWRGRTVVDVQNNAEAKSNAQALVEEVSRLISLPQDEEPTVATVSDPQLLKNQAFFANAKAGDKVLIYTRARKAVLYDPVNKKILEVAPLNVPTENSVNK